jgi:hypothetical protein
MGTVRSHDQEAGKAGKCRRQRATILSSSILGTILKPSVTVDYITISYYLISYCSGCYRTNKHDWSLETSIRLDLIIPCGWERLWMLLRCSSTSQRRDHGCDDVDGISLMHEMGWDQPGVLNCIYITYKASTWLPTTCQQRTRPLRSSFALH